MTLKEEIQTIAEKAMYSITNEHLEAAIQGLDLQSNDSVLAIAGSGDQAFAMLEYVRQVLVVDNSPPQINLVKARVNALREREYDLFLTKPERISSEDCKVVAINNYFSKGRLEKIRNNLENLVVLPSQNVFELSDIEVSKIYLSNAIDYDLKGTSLLEIVCVADDLLPNGLMYVTNSRAWINNGNKNIHLEDDDIPNLKADLSLTEKARKIEDLRITGFHWRPIVYRKVEVPK